MTIFRLTFEHAIRDDKAVQTTTLDAQSQPTAFPVPLRMITEFPGLRLPPPTVLDGPLFSTLMIPMRHGGRVLEIDGPISAAAMRNVQAFQEAWVSMLPDRLNFVEVVPKEVVEDLPVRGRAAVLAFSGGLDCTFTLLRHAKKLLGHGSYPITHALMVHGLDLQLRRKGIFKNLRQRVAPLLDELGVKLIVARSNVRNPLPDAPGAQVQPYAYSQAAQIAGLLHVLPERQFAYGVIGSTDPYRKLVLPWGSNPATDYLLSNDRFSIVHDGAAFTRPEKAALVAKHPTALRSLRVCLAQTRGNCGLCEKCVRTRLNLMVVGVDNPDCFDQPFHDEMIDTLEVWDPSVLHEANFTLAHADAIGMSAPWLGKLKGRIAAFSGAKGSARPKPRPRLDDGA